MPTWTCVHAHRWWGSAASPQLTVLILASAAAITSDRGSGAGGGVNDMAMWTSARHRWPRSARMMRKSWREEKARLDRWSNVPGAAVTRVRSSAALAGRPPRRRHAAGPLDPHAHVAGPAARRTQDRQVPPDRALRRSAVATLTAHRARQQDERRSAGDDWRENGLVFTTEIGTALEPQNVLRRFEQPSAGTHTQVVQEHLGHSSYAITADIYSHVDPAQRREAVDRLDQALRW